MYRRAAPWVALGSCWQSNLTWTNSRGGRSKAALVHFMLFSFQLVHQLCSRNSYCCGETVGPVSFFRMTMIEAWCIHSLPATRTSTATCVDFNGHSIPRLELVHVWTKFYERPHVFMSGGEILVERFSAIDVGENHLIRVSENLGFHFFRNLKILSDCW